MGTKLELLAPAKDAATAIEAINYGADAVYMGASRFGARASAGNTVEDVAKVVEYAHQFNARVYATVNTVLLDDELTAAEQLIKELYTVGVDAIIVQDMGILRLDIPPIALHSSTQCDLRTPRKAKFLSSLGFTQLVMARELTLEEIRDIRQATDASLEAFIYGALCVSYSGRCHISQMVKGRSANRGECAQMCRLGYDLVDSDGRIIERNKHLLSLRDLNMSGRIADMADAGVSSFKIEGRLKDVGYVKNAVAYFRNELDHIIASSNGKYSRSSIGASACDFIPDLSKCFNRTYTRYFLDDRRPDNGYCMATLDTPKSKGETIGKVVECKGNAIVISTQAELRNGDGLSCCSGNDYLGFYVNRVVGKKIIANKPLSLKAGTTVYRTYNKQFDEALCRDHNIRKIKISANLRFGSGVLALDLSDERGLSISSSLSVSTAAAANSDQTRRQTEALSKLGGTIYTIEKCSVPGHLFIPVSAIVELRRRAVAALDTAQHCGYRYVKRGTERKDAPVYAMQLKYYDNVANHLAEGVYTFHGATTMEYALEETHAKSTNVDVMYTRYCLRRELGACRQCGGSRKLPDHLYLQRGKLKLAVICDCAKCEMHLRVESFDK